VFGDALMRWAISTWRGIPTGRVRLAVMTSRALGGAGGGAFFSASHGAPPGWAIASAGLDCIALLALAAFAVTIVRSAQGIKLWFAPLLMLLAALRGIGATALPETATRVLILSLSALWLACALARRTLAMGCIIVCTTILLAGRVFQ